MTTQKIHELSIKIPLKKNDRGEILMDGSTKVNILEENASFVAKAKRDFNEDITIVETVVSVMADSNVNGQPHLNVSFRHVKNSVY